MTPEEIRELLRFTAIYRFFQIPANAVARGRVAANLQAAFSIYPEFTRRAKCAVKDG
jgi:hypothetical protein